MESHIPIVKNINNVLPKQVLLASREVWRNFSLYEKYPNMKFFLVRIFRIQPKYEKTRTRKNSVFGHF